MITSRVAAFAMLLAITGAALPALAKPAWPGTMGEAAGPALGGHDPVAYFAGKAALGLATITAVHDGATFRFASVANRDAFVADPPRYLPQFGGYCAWAASQGRLATPDPTLWKIVDGKLYLNCSKDAEAKWLADVPGNIARGAAFWATQP
jgi:hypothetical protein